MLVLSPVQSIVSGSSAAIARPTFSRDFAGEKTLNNGTGPAITFTRASNATFFDASGTLQTAANDTPRFDHDPATGASRGLLIEEARTNSLPNSQMTGAVAGSSGTPPTGWGMNTTSNGLSRQSIATGTINGFQYIDVRVTGTATATFGFGLDPQATTAGYAASSGQTWTTSCYFALIAGTAPTAFQLSIAERDSSNASLAGSNVAFTAAGSSLTRYTHTRTLSNASTTKVTTDIRASVTSGEAVDFTLRIAAPQLEQGAFATSYIPTTSAAATRAADSAVVTPISSFYNQSEGTLFAEVREGGSDLQYGAVSLDTDTSDNRIDLRRNNDAGSLTMLVTTAGALQMLQSPVLAVAAQTYKLSGAYKVNDCAVCVNGGAVGTDTSVTLPTLTHLRIGGLALVSPATGNGFLLNGHIRKIAYWPRRLSNSLLQQITT